MYVAAAPPAESARALRRSWGSGTRRRYRHASRRSKDLSPRTTRARQEDRTPCHFQRIALRGACGKTRVLPQNRRPDTAPTRKWGHDVRVLLSTYGGRGDLEPLMGLAVQVRALDPEVRVCAPPDRAQRPADSSEGSQPDMRTCPTRGSTQLETPVIRPAIAVQRNTAASEVSQ